MNQPTANVIEIEHLSKSFRDVQAIRDLSFRVKAGELFAFLGVNGAGKSTTISIMCGQLKKDAGRVTILGCDIDNDPNTIKSRIGVVFQNSVLDNALTVEDNLRHRASLYGIHGTAFETRLTELDALLGFSDYIKRPIGKLSGGQRRRIDIARALLHTPSILILDEPTTGLDPATRRTVWNTVEKLRRESGLTVFLTTHYMEEAADADYVVILDRGQMVAHGTPLELKNAHTGDFITLYGVPEEAVKALGLPYTPLRDAYRIQVTNTADAASLMASHPALFRDFEVTKGRMDDVFLAVTGKTLEEEADA